MTSLKYTLDCIYLMRLLLVMNPLQEYKMNFEYHRKVQGFIYSLLRDSRYDQLHDKNGYKFFCFSNIFKSKFSHYYHLIISSPNKNLINHIYEKIVHLIKTNAVIPIQGLFRISRVIIMPDSNLPFPLRVITQSPIITRIPLEKYQENTHTSPYRSVFWRADHPPELFIDALESNTKKKYKAFTGMTIENNRIFEYYEFKKQVSTKLDQKGTKIPIIGSLWEIEFSSSISSDIQKFALDCGLGERNSLGFGFVNPILKQQNVLKTTRLE